MKELLNIVIIKIEISENSQTMVFTDGNKNRYVFETYGDCCSQSWFSHVTGLKNLIGRKVNVVQEREEFSDEQQKKAEAEGNYEVLKLYGIMLKTDKGTCDIEFRNDSNGYYGGDCQFQGVNLQRENLKEVKEDF